MVTTQSESMQAESMQAESMQAESMQAESMQAESMQAESMLGDAWLAEPRKRSRLRTALVLLLAAALVFFAGVQVQKTYGAADTGSAAATGPQAGGFTPPSGAAFPGGGATDQSTGQDAGSTSVIGTVVSLRGTTLKVKDFGGKTHTISLGDQVRIVVEKQGRTSDVKAGSTVQVAGQTDARGGVTATTITIR